MKTSTLTRSKYLTFRLGKEEYGVEIGKVKEIIELMPVTSVPKVPDFVRGVINLRGSLIPVIELRAKFGMPGKEDTAETCIIVVETEKNGGKINVGVLVDAVAEVMDISASETEPAPDFGTDTDTCFISSMAKTANGTKILLNIEKILLGENAFEK